MIIATTPSVQLLVLGSSLPYNWSDVMDLGLSLSWATFTKLPCPANELMPSAKTYVTFDLPE